MIKPGSQTKMGIGNKKEDGQLRKNYMGRKFASAIKPGRTNTSEAVVPGIQEHRKCVQLNPEKGYLIVK